MAIIKPFEKHFQKYEAWFEENEYVYQSEILAIKKVMPQVGRSVEIGVGSGRFTVPLGIKLGLEPSPKMAKIARARGIEVKEGAAEDMPYDDNSFDLALMVTTLCFLEDTKKAFKEVFRILKPGGHFINAFVDKNSPVGQSYFKKKDESIFYRPATFYSTQEVIKILEDTGFTGFSFSQTIFEPLKDVKEVEAPKDGYGQGSFVAVSATKP